MLALFRSSFTRRFLFLMVPLVGVLLCCFPSITEAHAILLRSDPARDAVLSSSPAQISMWFTEDLNPTFSSAVVVNAANQRVDKMDAHRAANDPREMDLSLPANLPPTVYVVIWRTQSAADGHVLRGSFHFSVARADGSVPALNGATPGQDALGGSNAGSAGSSGSFDLASMFSLLMITLVELGVVFWVGAQLWHNFVLHASEEETAEQNSLNQQAEQRFLRFFSLPLLSGLLMANIGVLIGQGLQLSGGNWGQALAPTLLLGLISGGGFGTYWIMRQVVILLAIAGALYSLYLNQRARWIENVLVWVNLILGLALLIAMTFSGHAAATSGNTIYAVLIDWLHLLAASLWIGGMLYLATVFLPVLKRAALEEQARGLLTTLRHYSPLAFTGVVIMAVTGPLNATVHMNSFNQLFGTAYGRVLVIKVVFVVALMITSAIHVWLLRPRLARTLQQYTAASQKSVHQLLAQSTEENALFATQPEMKSEEKVIFAGQPEAQAEEKVIRQMQRMTGILRWEPVMGVAVLICTGLLAVFAGTLQPVIANQPVPRVVHAFSTTTRTDDNKFTIKLSVSPNHFGANVFTVSVLDSNGVPATNVGVSVYTTMEDMAMGTDTVNLQPDGKGHFSASGDLNMGGNWQLRVQIRTPESTLHEATLHLFTPF